MDLLYLENLFGVVCVVFTCIHVQIKGFKKSFYSVCQSVCWFAQSILPQAGNKGILDVMRRK